MENEIEYEYDSDSSISTVAENPKKKYKCTYENCGKSFFRPSKLENHKRVHTGEKPFKCDMSDCEKSYHRNDLLRKHQQQAHLKNIKYVECVMCQLKMRQNSLRKHMLRKHNSFRKWKHECEECGKGFRNQNELSNHLNEHSPIFRCDTCNKDFKKGYLFRKHMRYHKEYECLCKQKISGHNNFRAHTKHCEFTKPTCNICSTKFSTKSSFKEHLRIVHETGKNELFTCTFEGCKKQFDRKRNFNVHISKVHGKKVDEETRLVCSVCSLILKNEVTLWNHMKTAHIKEKKRTGKARKTRCDKNIPKVPMLTRLTGIAHSDEKDDGSRRDAKTRTPLFVVVKEKRRDEQESDMETTVETEEDEEFDSSEEKEEREVNSQSPEQSEDEDEISELEDDIGRKSPKFKEDEEIETQSKEIVSEFLNLLSQERAEEEEMETQYSELREDEENKKE